jgi:hypothetical protein
VDLDQTGLAFRPTLLAAGYTDDELRAARRRGEIVAVRRGAYADAADPRLTDAAARHVLSVRAAVRRLGAGAVVSHASAAALLGLPVWGAPLDRVHVTRDRRSGGRRGRELHVHAAPLRPGDVLEVGGLPVTGPARTVCDLAREAGSVAGVVAADAALAAGLVDRAALRAAAAAARGLTGCADARRAAAFAEAGSTSVGESRSRFLIARAGLPPPVLRHPVHDRRGALVGRTGFAWPELRTVGEFDGLQAYGRLLRPGQSAADAVVAEKLREDRLRDEGLRVVRWTWPELDDFAVVAARLRRAFAECEPDARLPGIRAPRRARESAGGARVRVAYGGRP